MTSEKSGERAAACRNSPLVQRQDDLIQREVRLLAVEGKDLMGVLLQRRSASTARHRFASAILAKALHPPDGGTDADKKAGQEVTFEGAAAHEALIIPHGVFSGSKVLVAETGLLPFVDGETRVM